MSEKLDEEQTPEKELFHATNKAGGYLRFQGKSHGEEWSQETWTSFEKNADGSHSEYLRLRQRSGPNVMDHTVDVGTGKPIKTSYNKV